MNSFLRPFETGRSFRSQFTARRMNDIQLAIRSVRYAGAGIRVNNIGAQTIVTVNRPIPAKNNIILSPFDLLISITGNGTQISVTIVPGTVNGVLPSNVFATLTETYDPVSPITYYASIVCVTDGKVITSSTWELSTTPPIAQTPIAWSAPAAFSWLFGVIVGSKTFRTIPAGSMVFNPTFVLAVPKVSITPNSIPYDNYYQWLLTNS